MPCEARSLQERSALCTRSRWQAPVGLRGSAFQESEKTMKRLIVACLSLTILALACRGTAGEQDPRLAITTPAEKETAQLTLEAIEKYTGSPLVQVNWLKLSGDLVFAINYATELNPESQPDAFFSEFNQVALTAANYFHQTDTQAKAMSVMAEDIDLPTADRNPPVYQVIIERSRISAWISGETTQEEFIASWYAVPLHVFPTPE